MKLRRWKLLVLPAMVAVFTAPPVAAQRAQIPLHRAGELVQSGPTYSIHARDAAPFRENEHCSKQNNTMSVQIVFDVPNDFQLTEDYLASTFTRQFMHNLAARICPNAELVSAEHYFKDRIIGKDGAISDAASVMNNGREKAFSTMFYGSDPAFPPSYKNELRIEGRSWNDVIAFNERGLNTKAQIAYQKKQEAERRNYQALIANSEKARNDYFAARKAELKWPWSDNWVFDVYVRGGPSAGGAPPARTRQQEQRTNMKFPSRGGILLAYVEKAQRQCGAVSPNGTEVIGFTLTNKQTGIETDRQSFPVDKRLKEVYRAAKLAAGAYNVFSLNTIVGLQNDMKPLFSSWQCDGPEFKRFIEGILKSKR